MRILCEGQGIEFDHCHFLLHRSSMYVPRHSSIYRRGRSHQRGLHGGIAESYRDDDGGGHHYCDDHYDDNYFVFDAGCCLRMSCGLHFHVRCLRCRCCMLCLETLLISDDRWCNQTLHSRAKISGHIIKWFALRDRKYLLLTLLYCRLIVANGE